MSLKQNDTHNESLKERMQELCVNCMENEKSTLHPELCATCAELKHDDDCDCGLCLERMDEERHEWDYDIAKEQELTNPI